jgi:hypothetical protein
MPKKTVFSDEEPEEAAYSTGSDVSEYENDKATQKKTAKNTKNLPLYKLLQNQQQLQQPLQNLSVQVRKDKRKRQEINAGNLMTQL